jgi:hypothetical protein
VCPLCIRYPYATKENNEWKTFSEACCHYYVATKWNGMNVLFFKYTDEDGNTYVTGKSKGSASLADGTFGSTSVTLDCALSDAT